MRLKFFIDYESGVPLYKQIMRQIEKGLARGVVQPGMKLPTVREVAWELKINPNTVARAYRELETEGIIKSIQGKGTFISAELAISKQGEVRLRAHTLVKDLARQLVQEADQLNIPPEEIREVFLDELRLWQHGRVE
jgi:GntR family transcriptional regulator